MESYGEIKADVLEKISHRPFYIAYAMRLYRERHGLDEDGLADELGCVVDKIAFLATSRSVRPSEENFEGKVSRLAAFVGANPIALKRVLLEETSDILVPQFHTGRCEPCGWDDAPAEVRCFDGELWRKNHLMFPTGNEGPDAVIERCWVCRHSHRAKAEA